MDYEGFVNFEDEDDSAVSIGIFDPKNTRLVGTLSLENVRKTQEFRKYFLMEKRYVYNFIKLHFAENIKDLHFNRQLRILKENDVLKTFERLKYSKVCPQSKAKLYFRENYCNSFLL